jgi:hypothetical protein
MTAEVVGLVLYGAGMDNEIPRSDCLMTRYVRLPDGNREYWPDGFRSRYDLCSCGVNTNAEAARPERAADRHRLEEFLALFERP